MTVEHFSHVNVRLPASKIKAVREFYVGILGLRTGERPPFKSRGYWLYAGDNPVLHLVEASDANIDPDIGTGVIDHLAFHSRDQQKMTDRLDKANIRFESSTVPHSRQQQIIFSDPVGTRIELIFDDTPG